MLALAPLSACARLPMVSKSLDAQRRDDLRQTFVAARDEGLDQFALELGIAAGQLVQRVRSTSAAPCRTPR